MQHPPDHSYSIPLLFAIQTTTSTGSLKTLSSTSAATAAHPSELARCFQDAINARKLSLSEPIWRHVSPKFEQRHNNGIHVHSWGEQLEFLGEVCKVFPNSRTEYLSIRTEVDEEAGRAKSFADFEAREMPPGVVRQGVAIFEWKQIAGAWKLTGVAVMEGPGMEWDESGLLGRS